MVSIARMGDRGGLWPRQHRHVPRAPTSKGAPNSQKEKKKVQLCLKKKMVKNVMNGALKMPQIMINLAFNSQ